MNSIVRYSGNEQHAAPITRDRSLIPEQNTWDLSPVYSSSDAWKTAGGKLARRFKEFETFRGRVCESAGTLYECLALLSEVGKEYSRLYCYASMLSDQDTRDSGHLAMRQEVGQLGSELAAATAFIEPEILDSSVEDIMSLVQSDRRLTSYRHSLDDIIRRKQHTLGVGEETILANASLMADTPESIYEIFSTADFPFPQISLHTGETVKLDKATFNVYRAVAHREDRASAFAAYFGSVHSYRRTFGTQLYAEVKKNMFFSRSRKYPSCLHRALDGSNIPLDVYHALVRNVNENLGTFHRYLRLRQRILGLAKLHYYDLYCPLVPSMDMRYSFEEARDHILASLQPLEEEYVRGARTAFENRWIDVYPNHGKRSGAYSNGAIYDVHPYILLNYNGKYDDVSTLTHEMGHTMHSVLSNKHQAFVNSQYSIFVAEVASTLNEALLLEHMLGSVSSDLIKLSLLGSYLDGIRGTVFRQTQFSEFELLIHEQAEKGISLTGDSLCESYAAITSKYYGRDKGVCEVGDEMSAEWAHVPHFYYNFYVYQYATSFTASSALSEKILGGDRESTAKYLALLSAGGSDYPIELLKRAGVDMTGPEPFALTMRRMNRVMDEIERILDRTGSKAPGGLTEGKNG